MRILFAFENVLPNAEADAEVFTSTARHLAPLVEGASLHVPLARQAEPAAIAAVAGLAVLRAWAPRAPAALRHIACGASIVLRHAFREADLVYTRNLWVAWTALRAGQRVVFDHYRPWPDQIPPLQPWLYRLMGHPRFLVHICHSHYTVQKYLDLGVAAEKLCCIHNGFEPERLAAALAPAAAKGLLGIAADRKTVVYTGRINHKKGLHLMVEAARRRPDLLFIMVGSYGEGPIEAMAREVANVRIVPFQPEAALAPYIAAADVLMIPPSLQPLTAFGSTVLPLKLFLYLAAGRPILAGATPEVCEVLEHGRNAWLCPPDEIDAMMQGIDRLTSDGALAARLGAAASADSRGLTWAARAQRIAALLERRLAAPPLAAAPWDPARSPRWREQSARWLKHVVRTRSWVMPPPRTAAGPQPGGG